MYFKLDATFFVCFSLFIRVRSSSVRYVVYGFKIISNSFSLFQTCIYCNKVLLKASKQHQLNLHIFLTVVYIYVHKASQYKANSYVVLFDNEKVTQFIVLKHMVVLQIYKDHIVKQNSEHPTSLRICLCTAAQIQVIDV